MKKIFNEIVGIQTIDFIILLLIACKVFNNSFQLALLNPIMSGDTYTNILMGLGIIKLWYYYKENTMISILFTTLMLGCKFLYSYNKIHSMTLFILVLAVATYRINYAKVCKVFVVSAICPAILKCIGVAVGLIPDNLDELNAVAERSNRVLHCMGYSDHNALPLVIFGASLGLIYLFHESKWSNVVNGCVAIFHGIVFCLTNSRTTFLIIIGILLLDKLWGLLKYLSEKRISLVIVVKKTLEGLMMLAPTISLALSMGIMLYVNHRRNIGDASGNNFTSRFFWASVNLANNNVHLFNQPSEPLFVVQSDYNILAGGTAYQATDNVWICAFLYGIPFFIFFILIFQGAAVRAFKQKNVAALLIITGYSLMAFMENIGTSNTRGMVLYMSLACLSVYRPQYDVKILKSLDKLRLIPLIIAGLVSLTLIFAGETALGLFIIAMILFYLWERVDTYENINY